MTLEAALVGSMPLYPGGLPPDAETSVWWPTMSRSTIREATDDDIGGAIAGSRRTKGEPMSEGGP